MVSRCELINIPANGTVPNFTWHFLPLTVTLKMHFHKPGTKVTSAERRKGDRSQTGCRFPLARFRGQKSNSARLKKAEGKRPGHFIPGFFPGLTPYVHLQLPMSQGKVEAAWRGCKPGSRHWLAFCPSLFLRSGSVCPSHPPRPAFSKQSQYLL